MPTTKKLIQDVSTRWNSIFLMLECALSYRPAFSQMAIVDNGYKWCPSDEEWDKVEKYAFVLRPFFEITKLFSGAKYPTSNFYFFNVWKIHRMLNLKLQSSNDSVSQIARKMKPKFDKYWENYNPILSMAIVLDPRYKMSFIRWAYRKLDADTGVDDVDEKLRELRVKMKTLFEVYLHQNLTELVETSTPTDMTQEDDDLLAVSYLFLCLHVLSLC